MLVIVAWIVLTLIVVSACAMIARKHGPEYIIGLFAALYVMANVLANKIVQFGPWTVTAGIIVFAITFYLTDMLSELYGKKEAKKAVYVGFISQVILLISVWIAIEWPAATFWEGQEAFVATLGNTWRIITASLIAYLISQNHDVWAYEFWKKKTKGKYLWIRNNASTIVSQAIDTVIFAFIAFYGTMPVAAVWSIIFGSFIVKMIIAVFDTPFLYGVKWYFAKNNSFARKKSR